MISKSQINFIKSLHQKKFRKEHGLFIVEGIKSFSEFIGSDYEIDSIFFTENISPKLSKLSQNVKIYRVTEDELKKISTLNTPQHLLAVIKIPENLTIDYENLKGAFHLVLDGIQDPGNLGTIIRTADWFGIDKIFCSLDTVEVYNPKVVQASMGSISRVKVIYTELGDFLSASGLPVYGALLDGTSIYDTDLGNEGLILLGNEGKGISNELMSKITIPLTIPRFGKAESLNVAVSASIFCSEIRRNS